MPIREEPRPWPGGPLEGIQGCYRRHRRGLTNTGNNQGICLVLSVRKRTTRFKCGKRLIKYFLLGFWEPLRRALQWGGKNAGDLLIFWLSPFGTYSLGVLGKVASSGTGFLRTFDAVINVLVISDQKPCQNEMATLTTRKFGDRAPTLGVQFHGFLGTTSEDNHREGGFSVRGPC